jgi:hypothetical protein
MAKRLMVSAIGATHVIEIESELGRKLGRSLAGVD